MALKPTPLRPQEDYAAAASPSAGAAATSNAAGEQSPGDAKEAGSPATPLGLTKQSREEWYRVEADFIPREQLLAALQHAAGKQGDSSSSSGSDD